MEASESEAAMKKIEVEHVMIGGLQDKAFRNDGTYRILPTRKPSLLQWDWRRHVKPVERWDTATVDWGRVIPHQEFANPIYPLRHGHFMSQGKVCPSMEPITDAFRGLSRGIRALNAAFMRMADSLNRSYREMAWTLKVQQGQVTDRVVARTQYIDGPVVYAMKQDALRQEVMQRCAGNRRRQNRRGR